MKDLAGAEHLAREAADEANRFGLVRIQLEASLAIAEIQQKGRNPAQGRVHLAKLANDARAKGFELIAREASAAASIASPGVAVRKRVRHFLCGTEMFWF